MAARKKCQNRLDNMDLCKGFLSKEGQCQSCGAWDSATMKEYYAGIAASHGMQEFFKEQTAKPAAPAKCKTCGRELPEGVTPDTCEAALRVELANTPPAYPLMTSPTPAKE